jgi:hypothetical protein
MMLCPREATEDVVFFGENDFNIFAMDTPSWEMP